MIPSYEDLTPGIPDVVDAEAVEQLTLFLARTPTPKSANPKSTNPNSARTPNSGVREATSGCLYACLRLACASTPQPVLAVARDFSPRVMQASDVEVLLDVSGLGRLIGEPPEIARQLARAMYDAGLTASVAIAPTQTMARLLATQSPDSPIPRLPDYPISRFPDLSVGLLRPLEIVPPGMNHRDRARPYEIFEKWGIARLGDLAALPAAELSSRLGRRGVALQRLARGLDAKPFVPDGETPRYIGRLELEWPIDALEPLSFVFARLLEPLSLLLERADRGAAAVRLELRLTDRSIHERLLQLPAAMRDPRVLRTLLLLDLESHPPCAAVDIVTIELDPAPARITQFSLLQRALPSPETLSTLTARLSALVGEPRIGSPVLSDTHESGAFVMTRYAPENRTREPENPENLRTREPENPENPRTREPGNPGTREPVLTLRRQRFPPALRVSVAHGRPVHVASSKRGMPHGAVIQAAGPWRTSGGWWPNDRLVAPKPRAGDSELVAPKRSGEGGWNRDEWDVALASGVICRIYQDRTTERWFLEAVYD